MIYIYGMITILICILIWFFIPYSKLKSEFNDKHEKLTQKIHMRNNTFCEELLSEKPELLQNYIKYCGLYNKPMMKYSYTVHKNANFLLNADKPMINIQYTQINYATLFERLAFIDSKMAGFLPLQGIDECIDGHGRMKGILAKIFTIFDVTGIEMDISSLVTILAEGIVCPSFLMNEAISWEELDSSHLKATLSHKGITVSGVFEFDEHGAITSFYTRDRYEDKNGKATREDWKAVCEDYKEVEGIKCPTVFKGIWIYDTHESIYFDCSDVDVKFHY